MITREEVAIIHISEEEQNVANYFAKRRELFEYPRKGYGNYNTRGAQNIEKGLLGELAFLELIYKTINGKYGTLEASKRCDLLRKKFSYNIVLGDFDGGFEFVLNGKTIDIKTYANKTVTLSEIFDRPYNLFIDANQNAHADIYVQAFILPGNDICIAGYYSGVPPLSSWMPQNAHACPVPELSPIKKLLEEL